jgi:hypothetical protein
MPPMSGIQQFHWEDVRMRKHRVAVAAATIAMVFLVAALAGLTYAQDAAKAPAKAADTQASYVSNKPCSMCHKGAIYDKWVATKHSKAFANLPPDGKKNPKCFACHTTGAGKPGGYDPAAKNAADLEGVGCEACHGPASNYKMVHMKDKAKALTLGLVMPTEATCKVCHEGAVPAGHKERPKFDFAASKALIEHKLPAKK